jgi:hypothetical protein
MASLYPPYGPWAVEKVKRPGAAHRTFSLTAGHGPVWVINAPVIATQMTRSAADGAYRVDKPLEAGRVPNGAVRIDVCFVP